MGKRDESSQPILVARDLDTKMTVSFLVQSKGMASEYAVKRLLAFLREIGHHDNRIIIKTDQESPIKVVAERLAKDRGDAQTILENSPVRSSGSNGGIERAVKEVEYQLKTMKSALDDRVGTNIGATSDIIPWMIEYSSVVINRYLVSKDGRTAYERAKGKASKMLGFEFAEAVMFRRLPTPGRLGKLESLWENGTFIGYRSTSGEYMIANGNGIYKARTVRRVTEDRRWRKSEVESIKYTPWRVKEPVARKGDEASECMEHRTSIDIEVDKDIETSIKEPQRPKRPCRGGPTSLGR